MQKRQLGTTHRELPAIGLGCMGLSEFYGPPMERHAAVKLLHEAIELGVEHFDTAEMYGVGGANEALLGEAFQDRRHKVFLATKFGVSRDFSTGEFLGFDGSRENCRRAVEGSLQRLKTDVIDLYYLHRVDPSTPIEDTVAAMAELVREGKVRAIGLSEASGNTIRRAAKIHPIAAVQSEYSIFSRDLESEVLPACREVGAALVAYSPLGRGMLTGRFNLKGNFKTEPLAEGDWRLTTPRYQGEAYATNLALVDDIEAIALNKACTPAQIALAWLLGKGDTIMALAGTTKLDHLKMNLGACAVKLSDDEQLALESLADRVMGDRYDAWGMASIHG
jgi:aryl-alcohol dehydrogenase-like predicted oxidoreductase